MIDKIVFGIYGLILIGGGFMGWKMAGSKMSLIMGVSSGILVMVGLAFLSANTRGAYCFLMGISGLLSITFLMRLISTQKFMPSGMLLTLSVVIAFYATYRMTQQP